MKSDNKIVKPKGIDKLLVWYESQPWLRAIIQAVPFIPIPYVNGLGGSVDTLLAWRAVSLNKRRVDELFKNISDKLADIEESSLSKDFLQSEEFFDLLRNCAEIVARTSSEYKRKHVADFLAGTIKQGHIHDLSQQIAEDLRVIQDFHLLILASLAQSLIPNILAPENQRETVKVINLHKLREIVGMDWGMFNKGMSDLERFGFIRYTSEATAWDGGDVKVCRPTQYLAIFNGAVAA